MGFNPAYEVASTRDINASVLPSVLGNFSFLEPWRVCLRPRDQLLAIARLPRKWLNLRRMAEINHLCLRNFLRFLLFQ